jgi:hypothetical protein
MSSSLRKKISSDIQDLNELHKIYPWIPNEHMVRPSLKVLQEKFQFSDYVLANWMTFKDFILDTHFQYPIDIEDGHKYVVNTGTKSEWNFTKSLFPYDLPANVNHYILWNSVYNYYKEFSDSVINNIISETLTSLLGTDEFDFAWYVNPKPSIPELWHCQVFWIKI